MSRHNSHKCEHKIELCAPCNTVYCNKCDYEWVERCNQYHNNWSWTTTAPTLYASGSAGTISTGTTTLNNHSDHASL